jgi:predicted DNA-binding transcriptional regulator YafY
MILEINPYKLFIYDCQWAVLAWSVNDGDILFYKLSEIQEKKTDGGKAVQVFPPPYEE